ncbi:MULTISPECIES: MFS transporter [Rhodococcus]|nr:MULTISPECIES: MFS transporter [Rhodococcus]MDV8129299.1 MFS transporter [Rhodococcus sp. IEGM 1304]MEA1798835.1 MFS transporter [Rhodococcus qingshengii]
MIFASTSESAVRLRSSLDLIGAVLLGSGIAGILIGGFRKLKFPL